MDPEFSFADKLRGMLHTMLNDISHQGAAIRSEVGVSSPSWLSGKSSAGNRGEDIPTNLGAHTKARFKPEHTKTKC